MLPSLAESRHPFIEFNCVLLLRLRPRHNLFCLCAFSCQFKQTDDVPCVSNSLKKVVACTDRRHNSLVEILPVSCDCGDSSYVAWLMTRVIFDLIREIVWCGRCQLSIPLRILRAKVFITRGGLSSKYLLFLGIMIMLQDLSASVFYEREQTSFLP